MKTIHKLVISTGETKSYDIPSGATIVHVNNQGDDVCVWYETYCHEDAGTIKLRGCMTGAPIDDTMVYVGTAHIHSGSIVVHVYKEV